MGEMNDNNQMNMNDNQMNNSNNNNQTNNNNNQFNNNNQTNNNNNNQFNNNNNNNQMNNNNQFNSNNQPNNNNNINKNNIPNSKFSNTPNFSQNSMNNNDKEREEMIKREYESLKEYNCSEHALRTTLNKLPSNINILKESGVSVGLTINPLVNNVEIPVVRYNDDEEIPRCGSCKAYINPFFTWTEGGDKWVCNMCKAKNVTLSYYYESFNKSGKRKDIGTRPEISTGSYEFYASKSFINEDKKQSRPVYIFAIDVSLASSNTGFLTSVVEGIKNSIKEGIEYEDNSKVSIYLLFFIKLLPNYNSLLIIIILI
jgi:hypothetical protein